MLFRWICARIYLIFSFVLIILSETMCMYSLQGQTIKIIKTFVTEYPEMQANLVVIEPDGEFNIQLKPNDFIITENQENCTDIRVINPESEGVPVSVVLMLDISGSMKGERLRLAKESAKEFLNQLPLETSEAAIASFSDQVYLNCDFTQNRERLFSSIDNMDALNGTNYSRAFLCNATGAIDIAKEGRNKKAIVFLTDGLSSANAEQIIKNATHEGITVYCITIGLKMPEILKEISLQTGGRYYEAISNIYQLKSFYAAISQLLNTSAYSILKWKAVNSCERSRYGRLMYKNVPIDFYYDVPDDKIGYLDADPAVIYFEPGTDKSMQTTMVSLKAHNQKFTISDIRFPKKGLFTINDSLTFPFFIDANQTRHVTLSYLPKDFGKVSDNLIISSKECPDVQVQVHGGLEELLRIISPAGGEVYPVGLDTAIIWEGIRKNKKVTVSYRANTDNWNEIGEGQKLKHLWSIPNDTGSRVQVRLTPSLSDEGNYRIFGRIINNSKIQQLKFSPDGKQFLGTDTEENLKIWDAISGKLKLTLGGFNIKNGFFSRDSKRILGISGYDVFIWDSESFRLVGRFFNYGKEIYATNVQPDGSEMLITSRIYKDSEGNFKIWSPESNVILPAPENSGYESASFSSNALFGVTLSNNELKFWNFTKKSLIKTKKANEEVDSIILDPLGKTVLTLEKGRFTAYNIETADELLKSDNKFYRFTGLGKLIITKDKDNNLELLEVNSGKTLLKTPNPEFYRCVYRSDKVLFYRDDTLFLFNPDIPDLITIHEPKIKDAFISPDGNKILLSRTDRIVDIYESESGKMLGSVDEFDTQLKSAAISPNGQRLVTLTNDNVVSIWSPYINPKLKEAISNFFSIVNPLPVVKDTLQFGNIPAGSAKEIIFSDFIRNPTTFPIKITGMKISCDDSLQFSVVSGIFPFKLDANTSKDEEIRFIPLKTGVSKAILQTFTPTDSFQTILVGKGVKMSFGVTERFDIGKSKVNQHKDTTLVALWNTSFDTLKIQSIENTGPDKEQFLLTSYKTDFSIRPSDTLKIPIRFSPKYRGRTSSNLTININGIDQPAQVYITGEGIAQREIMVTGQTLDALNQIPLTARVSCIDLLSSKTIRNITSDSLGRYSFILSTDRNYGLTGEKENYISGSENVDLTEATFADTIYKNIYLSEIKSGAMIRMNCIFFEFAKSDLMPGSHAELDRIVAILNQYPKISVEIHGHTDSIGNNEFNMTLSRSRANSVMQYLISMGIKKDRLFVRYFGEKVAVAPNSTEEGRAKNRRVEIKVI